MGQKNNSNFLRLNLKNDWNSYYYEKNLEDSSLYLFLSVSLKNYLIRFFKIYGIILFYSKTSISNNCLKILISFFITKKTVKKILLSNKKLYLNSIVKIKSFIQHKKYTKKNKLVRKKKFYTKRLFCIKKKKVNFFFNKLKTKKELLLNKFSKQIFDTLKIYFCNKMNFMLIFQKFNKGYSLRLTNKELKSFKIILIKLRNFLKFNFFKDILNILIIIVKKKKTINLLTEYISFQISVLKQHNFFLRFLKIALTFFLKSNLSGILGLKILLKGRVNGFSRSSIKGFSLGKLPISSFSSNISYYNSTSFTSNGTIGVKFWVFENV